MNVSGVKFLDGLKANEREKKRMHQSWVDIEIVLVQVGS